MQDKKAGRCVHAIHAVVMRGLAWNFSTSAVERSQLPQFALQPVARAVTRLVILRFRAELSEVPKMAHKKAELWFGPGE